MGCQQRHFSSICDITVGSNRIDAGITNVVNNHFCWLGRVAVRQQYSVTVLCQFFGNSSANSSASSGHKCGAHGIPKRRYSITHWRNCASCGGCQPSGFSTFPSSLRSTFPSTNFAILERWTSLKASS